MKIKIIQAISYVCNCHCDYCMNSGLKFNKKEVPVEDLIVFYNKLFEREHWNVDVDFTITGGEPFHPNNIEKTVALMEYLYSLDCINRVRINTNGYYPLPDICFNPKTLIQFSLDGRKEYCDSVSHKDGLFGKVMSNIQYCREHNIKYQTRTVVTDDNLKDIDFVAELAEKYKHTAFIQTSKPVGGSSDEATAEEILKNLRRTESIKKRYSRLSYVHPVDIVSHCSYFDSERKDAVAILVNPYGEIGACAFLATKFMSMYNIYNFFSISLNKYKEILVYNLKDKTCSLPDGLKRFQKALNAEQKAEVSQIRSDMI